ncbi:MAG TPA: ABC transporter ATP-binding protein [Candidatus Nanopelagicaceae bacterium]|nr:ABC transporter ATP-binding protein [Candidatus Nanopelagicaceae bacterium]
MSHLLEVKGLQVAFPTYDGLVRAVSDVDLTLDRGELVAIVGESGSGKTVTSLSVMSLHNRRTAQVSGEILMETPKGVVDIVTAPEPVVRALRGKTVAMIFQDPMSSLHPYYSIGDQLGEAYQIHNKATKKEARARATEMLELVGIPGAAKRVKDYPHQFSGGMRQRVMIAMALINNPDILIADEPTTALDVTVQAQILELLRDLQKEFNMGILLITHDLGVVAGVADRVNVMYAGRVVESGVVDEIYYRPLAPYTMALLSSIPNIASKDAGQLPAIPGQPPSMISTAPGCSFQPRCQLTHLVPDRLCERSMPALTEDQPGHFARCHLDLTTRTTAAAEARAKRNAGGAA